MRPFQQAAAPILHLSQNTAKRSVFNYFCDFHGYQRTWFSSCFSLMLLHSFILNMKFILWIPKKGKLGVPIFFWKMVWLRWIMHKDSKNIEYTSYKARPILDVKAASYTCLILLSWQAVWSLWVVWSKSFFFIFRV